jgi:peptidyl-tRNA hydrolase, PTH1 family
MNKFLIVGLGNIGPEYHHTRHNIGFDIIDELATKHQCAFKTDRLAYVADIKLKGKTILAIKPNTFMNLSGKAVKYWADKEKISLQNILIVVDDLALPLEKIRIRPGGSSGGHNGLKSTEEHLLTTEYPKLRVGIGNNYPKGQQVNYVLGKWSITEGLLMVKKTNFCVTVIESFVLQGITPTMNEFNKINITL